MPAGFQMSMQYGMGKRSQASGAGFEAEAVALFARFTTPPTDARKSQINALIAALKVAGVWAKIDALYVAAAADSQAATRNWKQNLYNATAINSPTFTADQGFTGNGSSSYLQTGYTASTAGGNYVQDSATIGVWMRTELAADNIYDLAAFRSGGDTRINVRGAAGNQAIRLNSLDGTNPNVPSAIGFTVGARSSPTVQRFLKNGVLLSSPTINSVQVPNSQFGLLGFGTGGNYSSRQMAAALIAGGLTDAEVLAAYNALLAYMQAVGAA